MQNHHSYKLLSFLLLFAMQTVTFASETQNKLSREFGLDLFTSANPAGAAIRGKGFYRYTYSEDKSPLLNGLYTQGGIQFTASPAFIQTGLHIEWMPISIFQLRFQYDYFRHLGNFGSLLDFDSADAAYGDDVLKDRKGKELTSSANRYSIHPVLRAKFGKIIVRDSFDYYFYQIDKNRPYFLARNGRIYSNRLVSFYQLNFPRAKQTLVGPVYEYTRSVEAQLTRQRLGIMWFQSLTYFTKSLKNPHWYFQAAYNIQERNREDEIYFVFGAGTDFNI